MKGQVATNAQPTYSFPDKDTKTCKCPDGYNTVIAAQENKPDPNFNGAMHEIKLIDCVGQARREPSQATEEVGIDAATTVTEAEARARTSTSWVNRVNTNGFMGAVAASGLMLFAGALVFKSAPAAAPLIGIAAGMGLSPFWAGIGLGLLGVAVGAAATHWAFGWP